MVVLLYLHREIVDCLALLCILSALPSTFSKLISTFTLTKMLNKANATRHVDVCIPLVSTFCLVTMYLINCYLIMYRQSAPELHYPLFLPILFDLYLLIAKCRIMATLIKKFLWGIYWIILPSTWRRASASPC